MENIGNKQMIRTVIFWGLFAIAIGGMLFGMIKVASHDSASKKTLASPMVEGDHVRGNTNPYDLPFEREVIIIEYSDFQCPACASYYELVKQAHKDFDDSGKLAIVYRHFPLRQIHANTEIAALSAEAAGKQNKFWEMHDMLFENQKKWENDKNAKDVFIGYATEIGLDVEQFKKDLDSNDLKQKIEADYQSGIKAGVNHTPTFFVNGKEIQNPRSYEEFKNIINEAESKKP